jgi:tetratricopeptide (TPR) repeat protein
LVVVGDLIGQGSALEQAIVGETPNLAARLQELAQPGAVVISSSTRRLIGGEFDLEELGPRIVKGFAEPVLAWRVLGPSSVESRFEAHAAGLTPLVGREEEIGLFLRRWEQACDGEGQVVMLSGEPGVGKSRIAQTVYERIKTDAGPDYLRVRCQCSPYYANTAFHPFIDQIERAAGFDRQDELGIKLDKLEALLAQGTNRVREAAAFISAMLSLPGGERYGPLDLTPQKQKEEILKALIEQLVGLSRRQPVLFVFEDIHWIDPTSLEVLNAMVDRIATERVLLVVTFRPEFVPPWLGRPHVTLVSLNRLARRQSAALVEGVIGGKRLPPEVLDQIVAKTDGVPLFVEELTKTVLEAGFLKEQDDRYELEGPLPPLAIPATLHDSLMARLDRLAPVKEVAQLGAAVGRDFSYELLAAVSPVERIDLEAALAQLVASELVFARGVPPDAVYTFKHALVQDAAYESLLKSRRQQLHSRIGKVLEERWPETKESRPELLAHHFARAGLSDAAVAYGLRAGQLAARRSAFAEAVAHLERALPLAETLPVGDERQRLEFELKMELADVLMAMKGYAAPEVGQAFERAYEVCDPVATTEQRLAILWGRFAYHLVRAQYDRCLQMGREALHLGVRTGETSPFAMAHTQVGHSFVQLGKLTLAKRHFDTALARSDPNMQGSPGSALPEPHTALLIYLSFDLMLLGYLDQARARSTEAVNRALNASRPHQMVLASGYSLRLHYCLRDYATIQAQAEMLERLSVEHGFALYRASAAVWKSWLRAKEGHTTEAVELLEKGISAYRATGAVWTVPFMLLQLADVHQFAGDTRRSLEAINEAIEGIERTRWWWLQPEAHRRRAEALLALGDMKEAEQCLQQSLSTAREQGAKLWELRAAKSLARLWQAEGKQQPARSLLGPVYNWFAEGHDTRDLIEARELLMQLRRVRQSE